jgi:hypothetical protein
MIMSLGLGLVVGWDPSLDRAQRSVQVVFSGIAWIRHSDSYRSIAHDYLDRHP